MVIDAIHLNKIEENNNSPLEEISNHQQLREMERVDEISKQVRFAETEYADATNDYLKGSIQKQDPVLVLPPMPEAAKERVHASIDKFLKSVGRQSISRRMADMNFKIASLTDTHIFQKKEDEYLKKNKVKGIVGDQQSWTNTSAGVLGAGAIAGPVLLALSGMSNMGGIGEMLKFAGQNISQFTQIPNQVIQGKIGPLSYEERYYTATVQSEKNAAEGIKNLVKELQQLEREIANGEVKMMDSVAAVAR